MVGFGSVKALGSHKLDIEPFKGNAKILVSATESLVRCAKRNTKAEHSRAWAEQQFAGDIPDI